MTNANEMWRDATESTPKPNVAEDTRMREYNDTHWACPKDVMQMQSLLASLEFME